MRRNGSLRCAVLLMGVVAAAAAPEANLFRLRLLHTNDMHARFEEVSQSAGTCFELEAAGGQCYGGFARVQTALSAELAKAAKENVSALSLNAGDTYQGTVWYAVYKWRAVSHFLKMLNIDAMALGNHEFDDGVEGLTPFLHDVGIPVLAANIDFSQEPDMAATPIKPSLTFRRGDRAIGVIGYLTPETVMLADVGKLKFKDEIESLAAEAKRLKKEGVDIIIALGHSGYEIDLRIAAEVADVDVVVGGHSHTFLFTGPPPDSEKPLNVYPVMVRQSSGRKVAMVQAYAFTKYLGILELSFDGQGELVEAKGNPILLGHEVVPDPLVLQQVVEWRSRLNATLKESIGKTKVLLDASNCRFFECNLGNLITDAYIHYGVKIHSGPYWTKAAIAIQQAGGIRTSINATAANGTITREDLITAMPFFSPLSVVRLKGAHLLEALEWSVARYDLAHQRGRGEFLQVSGLRVSFDLEKPRGSRVVSVRARCQQCAVPRFRFIQMQADYDVIMPTFLFNGGDNFTMFKKHGMEVERLEESDTEVVMRFIQSKSLLYTGVEDRLQLENVVSSTVQLQPSLIYFLIVLLFCYF